MSNRFYILANIIISLFCLYFLSQNLKNGHGMDDITSITFLLIAIACLISILRIFKKKDKTQKDNLHK